MKLDNLLLIAIGLKRHFPNGNNPYEIMTRLLEESGELAQQVNHFEGAGVKRKKHGEPDKEHLAKEVQDVITCALQVVLYYQVEDEFNALAERRLQHIVDEGLITDAELQSLERK
jgi:NTP pyrophosphatase (non-canonical NTP hydrolase)